MRRCSGLVEVTSSSFRRRLSGDGSANRPIASLDQLKAIVWDKHQRCPDRALESLLMHLSNNLKNSVKEPQSANSTSAQQRKQKRSLRDLCCSTAQHQHEPIRSRSHSAFDGNERAAMSESALVVQLLLWAASKASSKMFSRSQATMSKLLILPSDQLICEQGSALAAVRGASPLSPFVGQVARNLMVRSVLRRVGAEAYLALLLRHRSRPRSADEFVELVRALHMSCDETKPFLSRCDDIPLCVRQHVSGWQASLALLSWAVDFFPVPEFSRSSNVHPSSSTRRRVVISAEDVNDVSRAVRLEARHALLHSEFNETSPDRSIPLLARLQQLQSALQQLHPTDATVNILLPQEVSDTSANGSAVVASLLKGQWETVLRQYTPLVELTSTLTNATMQPVCSGTSTTSLFRQQFLTQRLRGTQKQRAADFVSARATNKTVSEKQRLLKEFLLSSMLKTKPTAGSCLPPASCISFTGSSWNTLAYTYRCSFWESLPHVATALAASNDFARYEAFRDVVFTPACQTESSLDKTIPWLPAYCSLGDMLLQQAVTTWSHVVASTSFEPYQEAVLRLLRPRGMTLDELDAFRMRPPTKAFEVARCNWDCLRSSVNTLHNYWSSLWIEAVATAGPPMVAWNIIRDMCLAQRMTSSSPVVLSPECAAAVASLVLQLCLRDEGRQLVKDDVQQANTLLFVIPSADSNSGRSVDVFRRYFKWLASDRFFSLFDDGSEAAGIIAVSDEDGGWYTPLGLLAGRGFRVATYTPNRVQAPGSCSVQLCRLNLDEIVSEATAVQLLPAGASNVAPIVRLLQSGNEGGLLALYKPAGVSTTLHVGLPSVSVFLANTQQQALRWSTSHMLNFSVLAQEGLVNRLDRYTSGVVLGARDEASVLQYRRTVVYEGSTEKLYYAFVVYCPPTDRALGTLSGYDQWLSYTIRNTPVDSRDLILQQNFSSMFFLPPAGSIESSVAAEGTTYATRMASLYAAKPTTANAEHRSARTDFTVLEYFPSQGIYFVKIVLQSGRRHQIRQHFASLHHPLLGDAMYHPRAATSLTSRVALHAAEMHIDGGCAERKVVVSCSTPKDINDILNQLRNRERDG